LFLTRPQRQQNDLSFYNILQEIRIGKISENSKNLILAKIETDAGNIVGDSYNTTHIVGTRQAASEINRLFCESLPFDETCDEPIISISEDTLDFEVLGEGHTDNQFKHATNLPKEVHLQEGARVMFLNNKMFDESICNGTVGVITRLVDDENVEVTFPTFDSVVKIVVQKETSYFEIDGKRASRKQFPLQNAFSLTVHKTQGLTLPHVTISIDENIFAEGQAYVALSRAGSLENLRILKFDFSQIKCSSSVLLEYERLKKVNRDGLRALL
jgi:ATP-dependent DNA helicase PIF1